VQTDAHYFAISMLRAIKLDVSVQLPSFVGRNIVKTDAPRGWVRRPRVFVFSLGTPLVSGSSSGNTTK
jgi:hypothetical protein